jgi:hypothetical protein
LRRGTIVEIKGKIFYIILMPGCANKAGEASFIFLFFFKVRKQARNKISKLLLLFILPLTGTLQF